MHAKVYACLVKLLISIISLVSRRWYNFYMEQKFCKSEFMFTSYVQLLKNNQEHFSFKHQIHCYFIIIKLLKAPKSEWFVRPTVTQVKITPPVSKYSNPNPNFSSCDCSIYFQQPTILLKQLPAWNIWKWVQFAHKAGEGYKKYLKFPSNNFNF